MKAITLWQPWATLMAVEKKTIETRSWWTHHRGPLAIHAAARPVVKDLRPDWTFYMSSPDKTSDPPGKCAPLEFPYGCVLATVELVTVVLISTKNIDKYVSTMEYLLGNYNFGPERRYMWITENLKVFDEPIPAKGRQGLWNWEREGV